MNFSSKTLNRYLMARSFERSKSTRLSYLLAILPLLLSILVQRSEHIIDNRFIALFGNEPLKIHSVFYIFLIIGQSIGIASSSSLLTLWKRVENSNKQFDLAKKHFYLTFIISISVAIIIKLNLKLIISHFQIDNNFFLLAETYLNFGILNIFLQSFLSLTLTLLIANDQLNISFILMGLLFFWKFFVGYISTTYVWNNLYNSVNIYDPMMFIGVIGIISVAVLTLAGLYIILKQITIKETIRYSDIFEIWNSEIFVSFIRSAAPAIFSAQLANFNFHKNFFVVYQLSLQAAYLLVLPIIAANQIAVRDASNEQSLTGKWGILNLKKTKWFKNYFICILLPNLVFLLICSLNPNLLFKLLFNFSLDSEQANFVSIYLISVAIGQIGNMMLVRLRSAKLNRIITFNTFISEILVQLGFMQVLLLFRPNNSIFLGFVVLTYCTTHLILNSLSVAKFRENN